MKSLRALPVAHSIAAAGVLTVALALPFSAALAQDKVYEMKISTPTIHDVPDTFGANFLAAVEKRLRRPHQGPSLPGEPAWPDPRADRRHAIRLPFNAP